MEKIKQNLSGVYTPEQVNYILEGITALHTKYKGRIVPSGYKISEKDVCLITYGDQVYEEGTPKLKSLSKFIQKYLSSVSMVHLLPFYPYSSDDGFSVVDYYKINEELGDWSDVEELAESKLLMFDAVINHISQESDWFQGFLQGETAYKNYFLEEDPDYDFSIVTRPRVSPLLHTFQDTNGNDRHVWTTFSRDQVDLNYANPKVFLHILDVLLFYVSKGGNVLRLDAIGFMWKMRGTNCIHLDQTHLLIKVMRDVLYQLSPNTVIITETNVPHEENISYFGNGSDEAHMVYNFTLPPLLAYSLLKGNTAVLQNWARSLILPSEEVCFFNFGASHDGIGVRPLDGILPATELQVLKDATLANGGLISYKTNADGSNSPYELNCNYYSLLKGVEQDDEEGIKRFLLSQFTILSMPGLPALYFHSFMGSENYEEGVSVTGHNRTINREKLALNELAKELEDNSSRRHHIYSTINSLIEIRSQENCFNPYVAFEFPSYGDELFAILKRSGEEQILAIGNFSNKEQELAIEGAYKDIISGNLVTQLVKLNPYGYMWLKRIPE